MGVDGRVTPQGRVRHCVCLLVVEGLGNGYLSDTFIFYFFFFNNTFSLTVLRRLSGSHVCATSGVRRTCFERTEAVAQEQTKV